MPKHKLTKHRFKPSRPISHTSFELLAAVESSPEPTTTLLGTERGHALLDTATVNEQETSTLESSKRLKFRTSKGAYWDHIREKFHDKSSKIIRGKARRSGELPDLGLADEPLNGHLSISGMGPSTSSMPTMPSSPNNPRTGQSCDHATAASASAPSGTGTAADAGAGAGSRRARDIGSGGGAGGAPALGQAARSPSPIPGTPGADPAVPEYQHFVDGIDPASNEPSNYDFVESLNPADLAAEFRHFVGHDPSALSSQDIKAQLKRYVAHHSVPVAPPERQVEVNRLPKNSVAVDRNNTVRINGPKPAQPPKRPPPHKAAQRSKCRKVTVVGDKAYTLNEPENQCTDTETETETEPDTEPLSPLYQPVFPTRSPSPLPHEHVPSVTDTLGLLGSPAEQPAIASLGTTQASTQGSIARPGNLAHSLARTSAIATETPDSQHLPVPSRPDRNRQPSWTRRQPSRSTTHAPNKQPPRSTRSTFASANLSRTPTNNDLMSTQKKAKKSLRRRDISGAVSGSSADLLHFIQNSGELAQALRELHRRQKAAAATGVALEAVGPMRSQNERLEEDLVPDNEEERAAEVAKAA
ncbi:hypothetical protein FRC06_008174, partial [Ceratobasidium sp. 370]